MTIFAHLYLILQTVCAITFNNLSDSDMEAIFDQKGSTVAWLKENEIFNLEGKNIGFLEEEAVFNLDAEYKGVFVDGFFRDPDGDAVAFIEGASNGPILPITDIKPIEPTLGITDIHPPTPIHPISPINGFDWSDLAWGAFIK